MLDKYASAKTVATETVELVCRNCGRKRRAVWVVARLLPRDTEGHPFTEVCHECLNEGRMSGGSVKVRSR